MLVYRILSSLLYPPDLARIVQSYSYSDDYAIANAKFPSLIARRDYCLHSMFGWANMDGGNRKSLIYGTNTLVGGHRSNGRTVDLAKPFDPMTDDHSADLQYNTDARNTMANVIRVPLESLNYIASLVSEYSLLPPFSEFDCSEEMEYMYYLGDSENFKSKEMPSNNITEDRFIDDLDTSIDNVHYEWSRRDNYHSNYNSCNLRLFVALHHECSKHYNYRHDWCERCSVDEYSAIEIDELDPADVSDYDSYGEENCGYKSSLSQASMSFYYREFLNGQCQCLSNKCLGKW